MGVGNFDDCLGNCAVGGEPFIGEITEVLVGLLFELVEVFAFGVVDDVEEEHLGVGAAGEVGGFFEDFGGEGGGIDGGEEDGLG